MKVITVVSGKGGSGKTSIAFNIALELKKKSSKCLLVDCSFGVLNSSAMISNGIGIIYNLNDVLLENVLFSEACIKTEDDLYPDFISGSSTATAPGDLKEKIRKFNDFLSAYYDYVIYDTPASTGVEFDACTCVADIVISVCNPDSLSISNTVFAINRIDKTDSKQIGIIINDVLDMSSDLYIEDIIDEIGYKLYGIISYDEKFCRNFIDGNFVAFYDNTNKREFMRIASYITNEYMGSAKSSITETLLKKIKFV